MDSVALWFDDEEGHEQNERIQRRLIRSKSDILSLNEKSFIKNFRLNKEAFVYVLNNISSECNITKASAIPPIIKLAAALKFLGQGGYQHQIGQDHFLGISQPAMSRCLAEVCIAIENILCPKHIKFEMSEDEKREAKAFYFRKSNIPGVIGIVDGTHIQMIRPSENEHLYFNRKLKHSMNAMVVCDHKMIIRAVDCRYGGASHDSHGWNLSNEREILKTKFDSGMNGTWILGDSGYPLEPWILTPYRNAAEASAEALFNENFSKARSIIERVFGVLKGRFRCLLAARELHYNPPKVARIMNVCCALHNICCKFNIELSTEDFADPEDLLQPGNSIPNTIVNNNSSNNNYINIAKNIRDEIKNNMI